MSLRRRALAVVAVAAAFVATHWDGRVDFLTILLGIAVGVALDAIVVRYQRRYRSDRRPPR
jgi:predicted PurR-regulated permease PerM